MTYTGNERSLTIEVVKNIAGNMLPGYPIVYQGRNQFSYDGLLFPAMTLQEMQTVSELHFNTRLAAFKSLVESIELGLEIATDLVAGTDAIRENLTACPLPE